jgi:hypothetical protein
VVLASGLLSLRLRMTLISPHRTPNSEKPRGQVLLLAVVEEFSR